MIPREACINDPVLLAILIAANLTIFLSYTIIPITLLWVFNRTKKAVFPTLGFLFVAFILSCGLTHLCSVLVIFRPAYHLEAFLCIVTGVVSFAAGVLLVKERGVILSFINEAVDLVARLDLTPPDYSKVREPLNDLDDSRL